mmetsp:Transcript_64189/g.115452  ORF Transcript_64189/g.115452 Transcript_64189/m.115452 type:complete len:244 (+) Transcript_64189:595-1326(+)
MCLLHRYAMTLAFLQALEHMLHGSVGRQDLKRVLCQAQKPLPVSSDFIVSLERILVHAKRTPSEHDTQQLDIDTLELVDLGICLRMPTDFMRQTVPEFQGDGANLLRWQICTSKDDLQNAHNLRIIALRHNQRNQALARLNVYPANLQQTVLVRVQRRLSASTEERIKLRPEAGNVLEDHLDDRLEERKVEAAHSQNLDDDVSGCLAEISSFHNVLEALRQERVLSNVIRLQICELNPAQEAL